MAEELTFHLEDFDGPLELLLALVAKHKMDLHNIPILELIDQYTATVARADPDPEAASAFIEMAARLVEMKSYLLLPRSEEGERLKQEFTGQLIEYDQCRRMAALLRQKAEAAPVFVRPPMEMEFDNTYDLHHEQKVRIAGTYLQNEWKNERWSLLVGGRLDKHNLVDHVIFSPRANLRFNPNRSINLRASYAGGFRAPQAFDEDLHVSLVGGERLVTRLADNLKEERSNSFSVSADLYHTFGNVQTNLLIEGFYTDLNDVFSTRKLAQPDAQGNEVQERYNAYGAKVYGLNIEGKAAYASLLELQAGVTLQKSRYDQPVEWDEDAPKEKKMLRTPDLYGYFTATIHPLKRLSASFFGTYTGSMLVGRAGIENGPGIREPVALNTPEFFTLNLKVAYDIPVYKSITLQVNTGVQNLTNAYQDDFDKG